MSAIGWRNVLEIGNGLWTIISFYLVVFLAYHLVKVGAQRKVWRKHRVPLSIQLAVSVWIAALGVLVTRSLVWALRFVGGGELEMKSIETATFSLGIFIGLTGFMCILRVATRPMLGQWPWVSALGACCAYLIWSVLRLV